MKAVPAQSEDPQVLLKPTNKQQRRISMMNEMDGWMGWGMGLGSILVVIVLVLAVAALVKYLRS